MFQLKDINLSLFLLLKKVKVEVIFNKITSKNILYIYSKL